MARKKKHPGHVNMERWLVSYADFVTLLFILFIILFSFSQLDKEKYMQLAQSMASAFGGEGNPIMQFQGTGPGVEQIVPPINPEEATLKKLASEINSYAQEKNIGSNISLRSDERGLTIAITGTVLYEDASATLSPQAKELINIIFKRLQELPNNILIEGHTDNRPIKTRDFPSNWELSAARSINLVRYLIEEYGFEPSRLSSAAYGEYRPVVPNDSPANQAKNRRVEIIILKTREN